VDARPVDRGLRIASAERTLGDALASSGNREAARGAYERALAAWPKNVEEQPREMANRAVLLARLGRSEESNALAQRLAAIGYRYPGFRRERQL